MSVWAYSSEVILGGSTIGIDIQSEGVMVIGFYKINGKYHKSDLVEGDMITKVEDASINTIEELSSELEKHVDQDEIQITYKRGNKEKITDIHLALENGVYKTGLYVKDGITGIGTLTFIDPATNTYGALGHEILESNTSKMVEVKTGTIFKNAITSIDASTDGNPGSKNAKFYYHSVYGDIDKNTKFGIYGTYTDSYDKTNLIPVASPEEVKVGTATIYTVLEDEKVDFVFIDPPYSTHINYSDEKNCIGKLTAKENEYYEAMEKVINEIFRIMKKDRYMALYVSDSYEKGFPFMPIGFKLFEIMSKYFMPIDIVSVVRHNKTLNKGNYHMAAAENNFYLRGFNYLFIMYKKGNKTIDINGKVHLRNL